MATERTALFPGSFDPITYGHIEIVERALELFDQVVIGVGLNSQKQTMFTAAQRIGWIERYFEGEKRIRVTSFQALTVEHAREVGARFLLRGLRSAPDFEYEKSIDILNKHLAFGIDTIYFISQADTQSVSSTLVREVIKFRGSLKGLVPDFIIEEIYAVMPEATS
jgi:pantetheine-phosphate adenylyltransferase